MRLPVLHPTSRLRELNGAFGDIGVLIPLEAALISINGLNPTTTLLGVGLIYILSGWYFRIPMPVQPLKALAAVAIAQHASPSVIAAAALLMAGALTLLSVTKAIRLLQVIVPSAVVRGVQLGLGIILLRSAYQLVFHKPFLLNGAQTSFQVSGFSMPAGIALGIASAALLLWLLRKRSIPAALAVLAVGAAAGLAVSHTWAWHWGPAPFTIQLPGAGDFWPALVLLVIPQLPLTLANSVIATADAAKEYFGDQAKRATPTRIALSIAAGNLWAGVTGGLPNCHGCGGLTAHYRLGARTPAATAFLGVLLIAIALLFGRSAMEVRSLLPSATLGTLILFVGVQHMLLGMNVKTPAELALAALVALTATAGGNLAIGAFVGMAVYWGGRFILARVRWQPTLPSGGPPLGRFVAAVERLVPSA